MEVSSVVCSRLRYLVKVLTHCTKVFQHLWELYLTVLITYSVCARAACSALFVYITDEPQLLNCDACVKD